MCDLGWPSPGTAQTLLLVPRGQALEAVLLAFPHKTGQRRQPDHARDHILLEAAVSQETCQRIQLDPEHDHAVLTARHLPHSSAAASPG